MTASPRTKRYSNPPVVEALCEVHFANARWDETIPGRFFDRVEELGFQLQSGDPETPDKQQSMSGRPTRLIDHRTNRLLQVHRDVIVVNQLRPYPHFEAWEPTILRAARTFADLTAPASVSQLNLRYINEVELPSGRVAIPEWFTLGPQIPPAWNDEHGAFLVRVEKHVAADLVVMVTFGSIYPTPSDKASFLLDLYSRLHPGSSSLDDLAQSLRRAHEAIEAAFESSITDKLRSTFEPEAA